jgi:hypothetical protein
MESVWTTKTSLYTGSPTLKPMTTETGYNPTRHEYTPTPTPGGCHCHGASSESSGMEHGGCGMAMTFQNSYDGVPVLIDGAVARSSGEFAGAIFAIFFLTILFRGLLYLRSYLEKTRWAKPAPARAMARLQEDDSDVELRNIDGEEPLKEHQNMPNHHRRSKVQPWNWERECGRFAMTVITSALGYAVMLITMTFVVVSFPRRLHRGYRSADFLGILFCGCCRPCFCGVASGKVRGR